PGAATGAGRISSPLRDRFGATYRLDFYTDDELAQIVERSAEILDVPIDEAATRGIARALHPRDERAERRARAGAVPVGPPGGGAVRGDPPRGTRHATHREPA